MSKKEKKESLTLNGSIKIFTYIVTKDFGFAPNPFHGFCTLATCKSSIRQHAEAGDWVLGLGSKALKNRGSLIYAMRVSERLIFNKYWSDSRFQCKKPNEAGSQKIMYGDNVYHKDGKWHQANSSHSRKNGRTHQGNLKVDTKSHHVLISKEFYYFGKEKRIALGQISRKFARDVEDIRHKNFEGKEAERLIGLLEKLFKKRKITGGIHGFPINWEKPCQSSYLQK